MDATACHNCLSNFKYFVRLSQPLKRQLEPFLVIPNTMTLLHIPFWSLLLESASQSSIQQISTIYERNSVQPTSGLVGTVPHTGH
jgi:hypothetical protein